MMVALYKPSISAHAYERFRQRVGEANGAQIDEYLLTDEMRDWLAWGVCRVNNYKGMTIACQNGVIITVITSKKTGYPGQRRVDRESTRG